MLTYRIASMVSRRPGTTVVLPGIEPSLGAEVSYLRAERQMLREMAAYALVAPRLDAVSLAEALIILASSPAILALRDRERQALMKRTRYDAVAARHRDLFQRVMASRAGAPRATTIHS